MTPLKPNEILSPFRAVAMTCRNDPAPPSSLRLVTTRLLRAIEQSRAVAQVKNASTRPSFVAFVQRQSVFTSKIPFRVPRKLTLTLDPSDRSPKRGSEQ